MGKVIWLLPDAPRGVRLKNAGVLTDSHSGSVVTVPPSPDLNASIWSPRPVLQLPFENIWLVGSDKTVEDVVLPVNVETGQLAFEMISFPGLSVPVEREYRAGLCRELGRVCQFKAYVAYHESLVVAD